MRNRWNKIKTAIRARGIKWEIRLLLACLIVSFLAPIITNNKPIYCKVNGQSYFPAVLELAGPIDPTNINGTLYTTSSDWSVIDYETVLWTPLRNGTTYKDPVNDQFQSPFEASKNANGEEVGIRDQHLLGTDRAGKDVFANLLGGIKYSLIIGLSAVIIAACIGIILGAISGYYYENYEIGRIQLWLTAGAIIPGWFYAFSVRSYTIIDSFEVSPFYGSVQLILSVFIFLLILWVFRLLGKKLDPVFKTKLIKFNLDGFITGITEVFSSVPGIILVVTLAALTGGKSTFILVMILGFTSWPAFARVTRAETLRIKQIPFVDSATALGLPAKSIIVKHILKNALPTLVVGIAFGIGATILVESALSFLNIGVPDNTPTLGALLRTGREHIQAWWLIVFPGLAIFFLIYLFNRIGDKIAERSKR